MERLKTAKNRMCCEYYYLSLWSVAAIAQMKRYTKLRFETKDKGIPNAYGCGERSNQVDVRSSIWNKSV
jgi:hypothetical protein